MAQKKNLRGKWLRPRLLQEWALGTLATDTLISESGGTAVTNRCKVTSIDVTVSMHNHTVGEGPLIVGVAHSSYTDGQIEEWLEAINAWDEESKIIQEQSRRLCRVLYTLSGQNASEVANDGKFRKFRLNWWLGEGRALNFWAYNSDSNDLTTGTVVNVDGYANVKIR